ncbi:hypothetical protein SMICM304S_07399 [Streptomyces microflavus]
MADRAHDPGHVGARAVRVMGLQQDGDAHVGGGRRCRAQPAGGRRVGVRRVLVAAAGEDADVPGAQVPGELDQPGQFGGDGLVVPLGGHLCVPGHGQDLHPGRLERLDHIGPFQ